MKAPILIAAFFFLIFSSCNNSMQDDNAQQELPKALEEQKSSEVFSKRINEDMVQSLYNDLITEKPELKDLEKEIENISGSKNDSNEIYKKFNDKNEEYFNSANSNVEKINDSLLKQKIGLLIGNTLSKYKSRISRHEDLLKSIDLKTVSLNDLHTFLKISMTLPVIEKYQAENLPKTNPLESVSKHLDETIKKIDTLINK